MDNEGSVGYSAATPPQPDINPLPSAFALWKRAWAIFRKRTATLVGIAAFSVPPMIVVYALTATNKWYWVMLATIIMVLGETMMMMAYIVALDGGAAIGANEAYRRVSGKLPRAIWLMFISFVVVFGAMGLLIIPGILFAGWFMFALYVLVLENQGGMNALFYSREYVRGKWWAAVGYMLLPAFICAALTVILNALFSALRLPYAADVVNIAVSLTVMPVAAVYMYLVYAGLKARKGPVAVKISAGRKTKYLATGAIGLILLIVFLVGSILIMLGLTKGGLTSADQSAVPALNR